MRIIDKNHDFYDYLQDPTDNSIVFDRRGSFLLEKSYICNQIYANNNGISNQYKFISLQCGATFWAFLLTVTRFEKVENYYITDNPADYDLELIATWKDYNKPNKLLNINLAELSTPIFLYHDWKAKIYELKRNNITPENVIRYFNHCKFTNIGTLRTYTEIKNKWKEKIYTIPLLNACGIANLIAPIDIFCAIEEYFSIEKTSSERTEAIGATNDDKIIMHGFDTKISFRGKQ